MEISEISELLSLPKLATYIEQVEAQIEGCFSGAQPATKLPALRLVRSGGKRLRSVLVIAAARSLGADVTPQVISAAAAIELAHLSSLVHDDIIDRAEQRGNVPSVYAQEGTDRAILVGDYMLAAAAREAARASSEIGVVVSDAIMEMCEGQMQETVDTYKIERTVDDYNATIRKKTAALIAAACKIGALASPASNLQQDHLQKYGEAFGMSFQLLDDLLDFLATAEAMGKPVHNDVKEGVYTLPIILSLEGKSAATVRAQLGQTSKVVNHEVLVDILMADSSFSRTLDEVQKQNKTAQDALAKVPHNTVLAGLLRLPDLYTKRALQKQTYLTT